VDSTRFDSVSKRLATGATRRRALAGLGALALGGAGVLSLTRDAAADDRRRCIERCVDRAGDGVSLRKLRDRCRRRCEDR
jgi:hypothetical protein